MRNKAAGRDPLSGLALNETHRTEADEGQAAQSQRRWLRRGRRGRHVQEDLLTTHAARAGAREVTSSSSASWVSKDSTVAQPAQRAILRAIELRSST
jgi:hypothetical protein